MKTNHTINGKPFLRDSMSWWAFIHAIAEFERANGKERARKFFERIDHEVKLTIDGEEMDFVELMERMNTATDYNILKKARRVISEQLSEVLSKVRELEDAVILETATRLGVELGDGE